MKELKALLKLIQTLIERSTWFKSLGKVEIYSKMIPTDRYRLADAFDLISCSSEAVCKRSGQIAHLELLREAFRWFGTPSHHQDPQRWLSRRCVRSFRWNHLNSLRVQVFGSRTKESDISEWWAADWRLTKESTRKHDSRFSDKNLKRGITLVLLGENQV